jgi:hypothetical protein
MSRPLAIVPGQGLQGIAPPFDPANDILTLEGWIFADQNAGQTFFRPMPLTGGPPNGGPFQYGANLFVNTGSPLPVTCYPISALVNRRIYFYVDASWNVEVSIELWEPGYGIPQIIKAYNNVTQQAAPDLSDKQRFFTNIVGTRTIVGNYTQVNPTAAISQYAVTWSPPMITAYTPTAPYGWEPSDVFLGPLLTKIYLDHVVIRLTAIYSYNTRYSTLAGYYPQGIDWLHWYISIVSSQ